MNLIFSIGWIVACFVHGPEWPWQCTFLAFMWCWSEFQLRSQRREFGLQEIELASNEDAERAIVPANSMQVFDASKEMAPYLPHATIIEGVPMWEGAKTNRFKARGDNSDGSIGIAPTEFRELP